MSFDPIEELEEDTNCIIDGMLDELQFCLEDPDYTNISKHTRERVTAVIAAAKPRIIEVDKPPDPTNVTIG